MRGISAILDPSIAVVLDAAPGSGGKFLVSPGTLTSVVPIPVEVRLYVRRGVAGALILFRSGLAVPASGFLPEQPDETISWGLYLNEGDSLFGVAVLLSAPANQWETSGNSSAFPISAFDTAWRGEASAILHISWEAV